MTCGMCLDGRHHKCEGDCSCSRCPDLFASSQKKRKPKRSTKPAAALDHTFREEGW